MVQKPILQHTHLLYRTELFAKAYVAKAYEILAKAYVPAHAPAFAAHPPAVPD